MVSSLLAIFAYKYLFSLLSFTMWEEYAIPGLTITFVLGVLLGINLGMLCIPRFFDPVCQRPMAQAAAASFMMKPPPVQDMNTAAMRYPSGFTAKQLQQHDFTNRRSQPIGMGRRQVAGQFTY
jgi:hypothetical protein